MKALVITALSACLLLHPLALEAQTTQAAPRSDRSIAQVETNTPLMAAIRREPVRPAPPARPAQTSQDRNWVSRHPAIFGALLGAGGGLMAAGTMENELFCSSGSDEDCLFYTKGRFAVGAGIGAGVGALVGWIAGKARR